MSAASNTAPDGAAPNSPLKMNFTVESAMGMMWEKSNKQMTARELQWFADGAIEQAGMNIRALSTVVEGTACLLSCDKTSGAFQDGASASVLLFNIHNQLDVIAGLTNLASGAEYRAKLALKGGAA